MGVRFLRLQTGLTTSTLPLWVNAQCSLKPSGLNFSLHELPTLLTSMDKPLLDGKLMSSLERAGRKVYHLHFKTFLASLNTSKASLCAVIDPMALAFFGSIMRKEDNDNDIGSYIWKHLE